MYSTSHPNPYVEREENRPLGPDDAGTSKTVCPASSHKSGAGSSDAMQGWLNQNPKEEPWYHGGRLPRHTAKVGQIEDDRVEKVWRDIVSDCLAIALGRENKHYHCLTAFAQDWQRTCSIVWYSG